MTLEDFRNHMDAFWASANRDAHALKDPIHALERLSELYRSFDESERGFADRVLAEWTLADDEAKRFDTVALIREFNVCAAEPELRESSQDWRGAMTLAHGSSGRKSKPSSGNSVSTERLGNEAAGELGRVAAAGGARLAHSRTAWAQLDRRFGRDRRSRRTNDGGSDGDELPLRRARCAYDPPRQPAQTGVRSCVRAKLPP